MSDTVKLLKECNKGCNTAITSIITLLEHIDDEKIRKLMDRYCEKHKAIEEKTEILLKKQGESEKKPGAMAETMIAMNTTMKVDWAKEEKKNDKALDMLRKGCEMGIETIKEKIESYAEASKESKEIADNLVKIEKDFLLEINQMM